MTRRAEGPDVDDVLYVVLDNLGKADAFITSAEGIIEQPGGGIGGDGDGDGDEDITDDYDPSRRRNHLAHMLEAAKLAVRAAQYAGDRMAAKLDAYRGESARTTALSKHRGNA